MLNKLKFIALFCISYGLSLDLQPLVENLTCDTEPFKLNCGHDGLAVLTSAMYGRSLHPNRCETKADHCKEDVLKSLDTICSGRRKCEIPNLASHFKNYCDEGGLRNALTAKYNCIRDPLELQFQIKTLCDIYSDSIEIKTSYGVIASEWLKESGKCSDGQKSRAIRIKGEEGQKINLTLWDFTKKDSVQPCLKPYGKYKVLDSKDMNEQQICNRYDQRTVNIGLFDANQVEIYLLYRKDHTYLLEYQVVGCPLPKFDRRKQRVEVKGRIAKVVCLQSEEEWSLTCDNNKWFGRSGNCSEPAAATGLFESIPSGIWIAIILGVAVILSVAIMTFGVYILRWQRNQYLKRQLVQTLHTGNTQDKHSFTDVNHEPPYNANTKTCEICTQYSRRPYGTYKAEHIYESPHNPHKDDGRPAYFELDSTLRSKAATLRSKTADIARI